MLFVFIKILRFGWSLINIHLLSITLMPYMFNFRKIIWFLRFFLMPGYTVSPINQQKMLILFCLSWCLLKICRKRKRFRRNWIGNWRSKLDEVLWKRKYIENSNFKIIHDEFRLVRCLKSSNMWGKCVKCKKMQGFIQ